MKIDTTLVKSFCDLMPNLRMLGMPVFLFEFAGAIGSGKTVTSKITVEFLKRCKSSRNYKILTLNEDITSDGNKKAIEDFYAGNSNDADLETVICGKRMKSLIRVLNSALKVANNEERLVIIVSDRAIEEDLTFINNLLIKHRFDDDRTISNRLQTICENIETFVNDIQNDKSRVIHEVIYLKPDLETAISRIRKRGRPSEQQISKELLKSLTTDPCEFAGHAEIINNTFLTERECALVALRHIRSLCDFFMSCSIRNSNRLGKVLISFYGVPGSGKTYLVNRITEKIKEVSGFTPTRVLDDSDCKEMVDAQNEVYTEASQKLTPDEMQDWIDRRRIDSFKSAVLNGLSSLVFTDVGSQTSIVFRKTSGCINVDEKNDYAKWFDESGVFDSFVNVVVAPKSGGLAEVRNHIKERGRPGEYEYFTEERLFEIDKEINNYVRNDNTVHVENDYTEECVMDVFHKVMESLINATIGSSSE